MHVGSGGANDANDANCGTRDTLLAITWTFAILWLLLFLAWVAMVRKSRRKLQLLMFIVPTFHLWDAAWNVFTYTRCECMRCAFIKSRVSYFTWVALYYVGSLGRLSALLLCLFVISTGAGSVRSALLRRNWVTMVLLFSAFVTATALGLPHAVRSTGIDPKITFLLSLATYIAIVCSIIFESVANSRVLKAQLLMIRAQGVDPLTCPAFHKFRLFTRLRKYVSAYALFHAVQIMTQGPGMSMTAQFVMLSLWEAVQLLTTGTVGWLFKEGAHNPYLESEAHLPAAEVRRPLLAEEVRADASQPIVCQHAPRSPPATPQVVLGWNDVEELAVAEDANLSTWDASLPVPAPPAPPAVIGVFGLGAPKRRGAASIGGPIGLGAGVTSSTSVMSGASGTGVITPHGRMHPVVDMRHSPSNSPNRSPSSSPTRSPERSPSSLGGSPGFAAAGRIKSSPSLSPSRSPGQSPSRSPIRSPAAAGGEGSPSSRSRGDSLTGVELSVELTSPGS